MNWEAAERIKEGKIVVNFAQLTAICAAKHWLPDDVFRRARFTPKTKTRLRHGQPVRFATLRAILNVVGQEHLAELTQEVTTQTKPALPAAGAEELGEWEVDQVLSPWVTTTNGLQFRTARLRHRLDPAILARGKCYELSHLPDVEKERLRECFLRHPLICRRIDRHPRIALNERMFHNEAKTHYWVIDKWEPGENLAEVLTRGRLGAKELYRVTREIAEGLHVLHEHGIIRRELSPRFVWLRENDGSVLLTDFELGKLLDGRPTVAASWPEDPYRAPEVGGPDVDVRADLYSWGRIFVQAATGSLPLPGQEASALSEVKLPRPLRALVVQSVALPRSERPDSLMPILRYLPK
ncbi:MAG: protein kinase [Gemmataceae bacterium]|nr:protein kinase [Gemmataceae bacterium]